MARDEHLGVAELFVEESCLALWTAVPWGCLGGLNRLRSARVLVVWVACCGEGNESAVGRN